MMLFREQYKVRYQGMIMISDFEIKLLNIILLGISYLLKQRFKATPHRAGGADAQSDFSSDCMKMTPLG